ncbi:MAG: extracellular solute-binding protein [Spirochaetaceae bacterium]|nr:extracellular solute-binding protein [Spirochaetaceae bacterium]
MHSLELSVGGTPFKRLSPSQLASISYDLPLPDGSLAQGLALGDIFPLAESAWKLEASTRSGGRTFADDDLAEKLFDIRLVQAAAGAWDLIVGRERVVGVESLDLSADLLSEDSLEFWASWEGVGELKKEIARFAESHGKSIRVLDVPNTQTKLVATARARGKLPDLVMIQSDYVPALSRAGIIQSVEHLGDMDIVPKGYEAFVDQGQAWAVPFYFDAQLVFYRPTLAGGSIPDSWTLEDMVVRARSLRGTVEAPLAWNAWSAYWLLPFVAGFGKESLVGPDGSMIANDEPTARALRKLKELKAEGSLEILERDAMISLFAAGKAAFILHGSYGIPEFERIGLDFGVAPFPLVAETGKALAPLLDFKGLAISRRTTKPILAKRLVQYLSSAGPQARFSSSQAKLPANRSAWTISRSTNKYFAQLSRSYETGIVVPPVPAYGAYKSIMWKMLRFLFTDQMDVSETLATADRLIAENLGTQ